MRFPQPLLQGTLIGRYKRFFADVMLPGDTPVTAHCPNSGSMLSVQAPGSDVWISPASNPDRKLKYTWEMIRVGDCLVGINTSHPNGLVAEAIRDGSMPELASYATLRREVKYGRNSRIDLLLERADGPKCYVEVKNVTMKRDLSPEAAVEFPDAVTARGSKHLAELSDMVAQGHRAVMVFLVQRGDGERFSVAADIDPVYADGLKRALAAGVEVLCYGCRVTPEEIVVARPLPMDL
ncbi:MAG: DNA/RNA nuclease SfsA [Rhodospirillales bacterium]|nr:DNA/RNA nuclease SfsA [Rhodospirillales bacterium]